MLFAYTIIYKKTKIIYNVPKRPVPKEHFSEMGPKRTDPNGSDSQKRGEKNENTKNNLKIKDR